MSRKTLLGARSSITGAASRKKLDSLTKIGETWQAQLWEIYEHLGPVHYGIGFKRNSASKVDYYVAERTDSSAEPEPTDNQQAIEALERLGDVRSIVSEFVVQENVAGEGYLVGFENPERFDVWSTIELKDAQKPGGDTPDYALRIWRASPMKFEKPDSPLRSVAVQCEQLLLLNEQIGATARSRLPAGLLLLANEFSFPPRPDDPPTDGANMTDDAFFGELIDFLVTAVNDGDSAGRIAPGILRAPYEMIDKGAKLIDFGREMDKTFAEMREELLRQIAAGLDLPPEVITGYADLNHWTMWGVDESAAKLHVDPDVLHVLDGLTRGYLWYALSGDSDEITDDAKRFVIWRDYSDLTSRPLSIDQAITLFNDDVISATELRNVANLAPQDETALPADIAARAEAVGTYFRAGFEAQAVLEALGLPSIAHTGAAPITVQSEDEIEATPNDAPAGPENVDRGRPPITASAGIYLGDLGDIDRSLAARIIESTEAAFARALERAGAVVRTKAKKDRQVSAQIDGISNLEVTRHLGASRIETMQVTLDQLIPADTFDPLGDRLRSLLSRAQTETRSRLSQLIDRELPEGTEEEDRDAAIAFFVAALMAIASQRLFTDSPDLDPSETGEISDAIAPASLVYDTMSIAGGGSPASTPDAPRGLALGQRTRSILADHGYITTSKTWVYGDRSLRQTNFEPHLALDGDVDPQVPGPAWLPGPFMFPGDHRGCACALVPTIELVE